MLELLTDPALRIVTLTITEGGCHVDAGSGAFATGCGGSLHRWSHPACTRQRGHQVGKATLPPLSPGPGWPVR